MYALEFNKIATRPYSVGNYNKIFVLISSLNLVISCCGVCVVPNKRIRLAQYTPQCGLVLLRHDSLSVYFILIFPLIY